MKKIAIVYFSRQGQTKKIAERIADSFSRFLGANGKIELIQLTNEDPWHPFPSQADLVVIGAPVRLGKFPRALRAWVRRYNLQLQKCETAFFSVSLNTADLSVEARETEQKILQGFAKNTGWMPPRSIFLAGALNFPQYNPFLRFVMKRISASAYGPTDTSRSYELTDWSKVEEFASTLVRRHEKLSMVSGK